MAGFLRCWLLFKQIAGLIVVIRWLCTQLNGMELHGRQRYAYWTWFRLLHLLRLFRVLRPLRLLRVEHPVVAGQSAPIIRRKWLVLFTRERWAAVKLPLPLHNLSDEIITGATSQALWLLLFSICCANRSDSPDWLQPIRRKSSRDRRCFFR